MDELDIINVGVGEGEDEVKLERDDLDERVRREIKNIATDVSKRNDPLVNVFDKLQ